jgi:hypothetical protein
VGGQHGYRFVLGQWTVGFHLACMVLHVIFVHERNIVGPLFGEILYAQDIFQFFTQAMVQGSALRHIMPIEVHD